MFQAIPEFARKPVGKAVLVFALVSGMFMSYQVFLPGLIVEDSEFCVSSMMLPMLLIYFLVICQVVIAGWIFSEVFHKSIQTVFSLVISSFEGFVVFAVGYLFIGAWFLTPVNEASVCNFVDGYGPFASAVTVLLTSGLISILGKWLIKNLNKK